MPRRYRLGCPAWGDKTWIGRLFPRKTKATELLWRYARVFDTVEGNTTFYALPKPDTVRRWGDAVPDTFRFCFKFPRGVTHDQLLAGARREAEVFLERLAPLGSKLGVLMIQLPARFGYRELERLDRFLAWLPRRFHYAVELRHPVFFNGDREEREAMDLLRARGADWVILDARGLHAGDDPHLAEVRRRKPRLPIVMRATGDRPIVRIVPHEDFEAGWPFVAPWIEQVARWIEAGKRPYVFVHAPVDTYAPENAYRFHERLSARIEVGALPPWPDHGASSSEQLTLF